MKKYSIILVIIMICFSIFGETSPSKYTNEKTRLVILQFDSYLVKKDDAKEIQNYFSSTLAVYKQFDIVKTREINKAINRLKYQDKKKYTQEEAVKIANKTNARLILTGQYMRDGFVLKLTTKLIDADLNKVIFEREDKVLTPTKLHDKVQLIAGDLIQETFIYSVDSEKVAILPFAPFDIDDKILETFTRELKESIPIYKQFMVINDTTLNTALEELGLSGGPVVDESMALQICKKLNTRFVIFGKISRENAGLLFEIKAVELDAEELVHRKLYTTSLFSQIPDVASRVAKNISYETDIDIYDDDEIVNIEYEKYSKNAGKNLKVTKGLFIAGVSLSSVGLASSIAGCVTLGLFYTNLSTFYNTPEEDRASISSVVSNYRICSAVLLGAGIPIFTMGLIQGLLSIYYYVNYRNFKKQQDTVSFSPIIDYYNDMAVMGVTIKF